ncbi:MAG: response regulator transcription factor [Ignavibacteriales bacterium]|nr:response regulator transcription factor [Ignavibacteriales bacterium]
MLEVSYLADRLSLKAYISIIGIAFLALGVFLGLKHRRRKVLVSYKEVDLPPGGMAAPLQEGLLTERELEVLRHIAGGRSNQEIADTLFVSLNTVKTHTNNIYGKLGVKRRTQALDKARQLKLL